MSFTCDDHINSVIIAIWLIWYDDIGQIWYYYVYKIALLVFVCDVNTCTVSLNLHEFHESKRHRNIDAKTKERGSYD